MYDLATEVGEAEAKQESYEKQVYFIKDEMYE